MSLNMMHGKEKQAKLPPAQQAAHGTQITNTGTVSFNFDGGSSVTTGATINVLNQVSQAAKKEGEATNPPDQSTASTASSEMRVPGGSLQGTYVWVPERKR